MNQLPMRDRLRAIPVFAGPLEGVRRADFPDDPAAAFARWLDAALADGVPQPHAAVLSTVDERAKPDGRVLILKDLDETGWWFASGRSSAKGVQLAAMPEAALTFYWPGVGRQVRVRGRVEAADPSRSAADFLDRSDAARAVALTGRQSRPLSSAEECDAAVEEQMRRLDDEPGAVADDWTVYALRPRTVEFWQADSGRRHTRVLYRRVGHGWTIQLLWP